MSQRPQPEYVVHYFNVRGAAELIRYLLKAHGTEFVDERYEWGPKWDEAKERRTMSQKPEPKYVLSYFNVRGLAELLRCLFKAHGTEFEDRRFQYGSPMSEATKEKMPYGQVPVLEVHGVQMSQSFAVARYLAEEFGYLGSNAMERYRIDEFVELSRDMVNDAIKVLMERDETRKEQLKKEFANDKCPVHLMRLTKFLQLNKKKKDGYLVGEKLSLADIQLINALNWLPNLGINIDAYADLKRHKEKIENLPNIAAWIKDRPVTEF